MYYIIILLAFFNITNPQKNKFPEPIILLERTMCYGTCPAYKIEIYQNGEGFYHGNRFVNKKGKFEFSIKNIDISYIIKKAEEINFFDMEDQYTEAISDLPKTYIKIKNKLIEDYYGAPQELKELEKLIDKVVLKNLNWKSYSEKDL